jgi:hypothetical protein
VSCPSAASRWVKQKWLKEQQSRPWDTGSWQTHLTGPSLPSLWFKTDHRTSTLSPSSTWHYARRHRRNASQLDSITLYLSSKIHVVAAWHITFYVESEIGHESFTYSLCTFSTVMSLVAVWMLHSLWSQRLHQSATRNSWWRWAR